MSITRAVAFLLGPLVTQIPEGSAIGPESTFTAGEEVQAREQSPLSGTEKAPLWGLAVAWQMGDKGRCLP